MKKLLAFLVAVVFTISAIPVGASTKIEKAIHRVAPFDLIDTGDLSKQVTRADAVSALVKLVVGEADLTGTSGCVFEDVPADHPAAGYVYYAYKMGWVSGVSSNSYAPENIVTLQQFVKIAVSALGYRVVAESSGGYAAGYYHVAAEIGMLKGVEVKEDQSLTVSDMLVLIYNMLDAKTLEQTVGTDEWKQSDETFYAQLLKRYDLREVDGIVNAVGNYFLSNGRKLNDGEIMIGNEVFLYDTDEPLSILGKSVSASCGTTESSSKETVVNLFERDPNATLKIPAADIEKLAADEITYYSDSTQKNKTLKCNGAEFVYNGAVIRPESVVVPETGTVTLLDREENGTYDVVFIDEYESLIIDKISTTSETVYFDENENFRGKTAFKFDSSDSDKEYALYDINGNKLSFEDLKVGMAISFYADINEELVNIVASNKTVKGQINALSKTDFKMTVGEEEYAVYKPGAAQIFASGKIGQSGVFVLNHENEIVGTSGELFSDGLYGYVIGFSRGKGLGTPKLQVITAGESIKEVEESGDDEIITYTYTNGSSEVYEFADTVNLSIEGRADNRVSSSTLTSDMFARTAVFYKLNGDGKIVNLKIYSVPVYETAKLASYYLYSFNGELNSFGGYASKNAFFIGESTQVICIPTVTSPNVDDYTVDVTISDKSSYTIMPIEIDETNQIADCAILIEKMDATSLKPFKANAKVSIVGSVINSVDENGDMNYKLNVLTGDKVENPFITMGGISENVVRGLRCGDLIRYNTRSDGEIANIENLRSLCKLEDSYFINRESSETEEVYGYAQSISLDRLDNLRNERVDQLVLNIEGREKTYILKREDAPSVYSYNRSTGEIKKAETEEIISYDSVGEDASDIFMLVNENNVNVVVILVD